MGDVAGCKSKVSCLPAIFPSESENGISSRWKYLSECNQVRQREFMGLSMYIRKLILTITHYFIDTSMPPGLQQSGFACPLHIGWNGTQKQINVSKTD